MRLYCQARLPDEITAAIKDADRIAAYFEATRLAGFDEAEARNFFGAPEGLQPAAGHGVVRLQPTASDVAQARFLHRFATLASDGVRRT